MFFYVVSFSFIVRVGGPPVSLCVVAVCPVPLLGSTPLRGLAAVFVCACSLWTFRLPSFLGCCDQYRENIVLCAS